ncbi:MAG: ABC transporter permease subunit [Verrucomicrobiota bacterium]|jgi:hypothetical protein
MTVLPIVARELRVAARSRMFYLGRFLTALGAVGLGSYLMVVVNAAGFVGRVQGGRVVFTSLAWVGLLYCIGLARNTVDCVSEEKREGTLGLLFLTDLKGYDVALGKLCANSVKSFYGLLAAVPVVCCAWVIGGVSAGELWRTALALLNIFFFSQAAGLFVSTFSRDARRATGGATALLLFFFAGIPGLAVLLRYEHCFAWAAPLELLNPAWAFTQAGAIGTRHNSYWQSLSLVHLVAWLFLALASLALPRCWQDKPAKAETRWSARLRQWTYGPPAAREALRLRLIGTNPFLWLVSRNRLGQISVWAVLGLIGCGWIWVWFFSDIHLPDSMPIFVMTIVLNHAVLKFWIASEAGWHLSEQRRSGALEYLLSCTPLSEKDIIAGQWLALRRRFLAPLVAVLALDVVLIALSMSPATGNTEEAKGNFIGCVICGMIMLPADALAIGWVGMWRAMLEKRPRTAAGETVARILVLPWLLIGLIGAMGGIPSGAAVLVLWFLLGIGIDIGFATTARQQLLTQFRIQAARRPEEPLGILGRLGRWLGRMMR